jgi:hypothetical protein
VNNPSIKEVVEAATERSNTSSVAWYGLETLIGRPWYLQMPNGAAAKLRLIGSAEAFTPTPTYDKLNTQWQSSEYAPPNGASLGPNEANTYDGLCVLSLSVIETNSTEPLKLMKAIPEVASGYVGATGRCTPNRFSDRQDADFDFYQYALVDGNMKNLKLDSYRWEADEFTWSDAE